MNTDTNNPLPLELFQQIKAIQIRTQRLVSDVLAGEYESAFKGRGMEFEEVREYQPGDDVRHIDWNVTARMDAPYVKEFREERELTVMLIVDVSSSGAFGSTSKTKNEIAAEVAAVLAYTAIRSNDRVGLIIFTDEIEHFIPPKKGRAHVWRVIRDILTFRPKQSATDLQGALEFLRKVVPRRCVAFLISDFITGDDNVLLDRLRTTARHHDITAVRITDPREVALPSVGIIELEDAETGEFMLVDTSNRQVVEGYRLLGAKERRKQEADLRSAAIGQIDIRTDRPYIDPIVRFFRARDR